MWPNDHDLSRAGFVVRADLHHLDELRRPPGGDSGDLAAHQLRLHLDSSSSKSSFLNFWQA
jgi:hypothetical protein